VTPATLHPDLAGAVAGAVLAFTIWLLPSCEEPDPFDPPPLWIELEKRHAEPAVIFQADRPIRWMGEELEPGVAEGIPQS
jgi:hypothetical protein